MPERLARGKRPAVTITLDKHDVPILPSINRNSRSKDLQNIFQDFVTAHYSKPFQVKLTPWAENCAIPGMKAKNGKASVPWK